MRPSPSRFQWQFDWKSVLAILLILPILLSLGFWQLGRADEKAALLADFEHRRNLRPVEINGVTEYQNYLPVTATGEFDSQRYWLLDNRISHGRFGYEIMAIFTLADGRELLVNRGWLAGDPSRQTLPKVAIPRGRLQIFGELYRNSEKAFSLGGELIADTWPRRQQWLDLDDLGDEFPALLPTTLRLAGGSDGALEVERMVVNVTPAKHTGYAVQWFAMAMALGLIFIFRNSNLGELLKRRESNESEDQ